MSINNRVGHANGLSSKMQFDDQQNPIELTLEQREAIIAEATQAYERFLEALGVDWRNDPNSSNTPRRVAKAFVNDLWVGRFTKLPEITTFPNDGYTGMVFEGGIPVVSMCSHHHQTIWGKANIAYIPGKKMIGLSKLNRIVEYYARRGQIQELLTKDVHTALVSVLETEDVAVMMEATHNCVQCRGVKHIGAKMITSELAGDFIKDHKVRDEFYRFVERI